jgi:hypothetical protein
VTPATAGELRRCAGVYALPSGEALEVAAEPGRLVATAEGPEGMALLAGPLGRERQRRFAERDRQVGAALTAALHGNLKPVGEILVDSEEGARRWRAALAKTEATLGAWKGATVLGTRSLGGLVVTHARLTFAKGKGTRILDVIWAGPNADHLAVVGKLRPVFFLPEGPTRFVTYDVGTGSVVRLSCGGKAPALRFEGAGGAVEARRKSGS